MNSRPVLLTCVLLVQILRVVMKLSPQIIYECDDKMGMNEKDGENIGHYA